MSIQGKSPRTVRAYISALCTWNRLNNLINHCEHFLVRKDIIGMHKIKVRRDIRKPITFPILQRIVGVLPAICRSSYEAQVFKSAFTLAFFGFLRVSELVCSSQADDSKTSLQINDVSFSGEGLTLRIRFSKTDQFGRGTLLSISPTASELCPVRALSLYLASRPRTSSQLFVHFDGSPLTRYQFQAILNKSLSHVGYDATQYTSHSFRIGAATTAAINGLDESIIQQYGRWTSCAYQGYIRI
ncbi:integrase/recombinase xerD homolog [Haliotis asinina]|uniref:integrase/recombinase xerD homolog n=1 Tax=Haliotis asinina TaxID=109174 RepID=UPI003531C72C